MLKDFQGYLIVDGHDGFEPVAQREGVKLVNCNNHARRAFVRAEGREMTPDQRRRLRQEKVVPVFEKF